ncbi:MAG TPA: FtsX-like permease family protein [Methylomirabilota bacterium]
MTSFLRPSILRRASLRSLTLHPWQVGLSVLGIALGVAVVLAVDLANTTARDAFALFADTIAGRATHVIVGGPSGVPEDVYRRLRVELGVRPSAPVVERDVSAPAYPGVAFHLLGVDPFAEPPFRSLGNPETPGGLRPLAILLTRPNSVLVARDTARRLRIAAGDDLVIRVGIAHRRLTVVGELTPADELSAQAFESLLLTDIATAQELLSMGGRLSRIDLIVAPGAAARETLARIGAVLPAGVDVVSARARADAVEQLTRAFRVNLSALSLLALVVGLFLVYNAMTFSVVQRRELFGVLRALGVGRREVFILVLGEALAIGIVATLLGVGLGIVLGHGLVRLVARTINDLYATITVSSLAVSPGALARAVALGIAGTVVAAIAPALEATVTSPRAVLARSVIERRARRAAPRLGLLGVVTVGAGWGILRMPGGGMPAAYAGLFAFLLGAALLTPVATILLVAGIRAVAGRALGMPARMAAGAVVQTLSRTSVALAALTIAVAATVGIGIMIQSFRETVVRWLEASLQADVYVSSPSLVSNRPDATLDPALAARLVSAPGVAHANRLRAVRVPSPGGAVQLVALDADARGYRGFRLKAGNANTLRDDLAAGAVVVSEPFAYRRHLDVGSRVRLRTDRGEHDFAVAAVYYDYGSSEGTVLMSRAVYDRLWDDREISSLGLYAAPGVDVEALVASLRARAGADADVLIRSNRALRTASLAVFDRTFAVTIVLRHLATIVAFLGVLSALTALVLERSREVAILRAQGFTPREVWRLVTGQTAVMGLVAGVLAIPVGIGLALVLVFVINQRSFGWTLELEVPARVLAQAVLLSVGAAVLAGLYPARRLSRLGLPEALRGE